MNIKCHNCNSYKTKKRRSIIFYLVLLSFIGIAFSIFDLYVNQYKDKPFLLTLVLIFVMIGYNNSIVTYKCKSCGFKFNKNESKIEDSTLVENLDKNIEEG